MIYVTIGTMFLPFTRLLKQVDALAAASDEPFIVQTGMDTWRPPHCDCFDFKSREEIFAIQREARIIITHAGIGSVIDALHLQKPLIVVPRRLQYGEHTNDHQMDLAQAVERRNWGRLILDVADLDNACAHPPIPPQSYTPAKQELLGALKSFIAQVQSRKQGKEHR